MKKTEKRQLSLPPPCIIRFLHRSHSSRSARSSAGDGGYSISCHLLSNHPVFVSLSFRASPLFWVDPGISSLLPSGFQWFDSPAGYFSSPAFPLSSRISSSHSFDLTIKHLPSSLRSQPSSVPLRALPSC